MFACLHIGSIGDNAGHTLPTELCHLKQEPFLVRDANTRLSSGRLATPLIHNTEDGYSELPSIMKKFINFWQLCQLASQSKAVYHNNQVRQCTPDCIFVLIRMKFASQFQLWLDLSFEQFKTILGIIGQQAECFRLLLFAGLDLS